MTDLEKRAEEYANKEVYYGAYVDDEAGKEIVKDTYIDATQKETELLSKHLLEMQKTNGALTDRVNELEAQIKNITGLLNDILWKCTCKEYEKATQDLKELINELEVKE